MGKAHITRHSARSGFWAALKISERLPVLDGHVGDSITLDFSAQRADSLALEEGIYEITIVGADARLKIGNAAQATAANGQYWLAGRTDVRVVRQGERISVLTA